jgi:hypothetical protein
MRRRRPLAQAEQTSAANLTVSKIEIGDHFSADPLREPCNLGKGLLAFGVFGNGFLRLLIGRLVGVLHDDQPVSDIRAGLKLTQPIADPVFAIGGLQATGATASIVPPR